MHGNNSFLNYWNTCLLFEILLFFLLPVYLAHCTINGNDNPLEIFSLVPFVDILVIVAVNFSDVIVIHPIQFQLVFPLDYLAIFLL